MGVSSYLVVVAFQRDNSADAGFDPGHARFLADRRNHEDVT
jgi:hypothetical protein